VTDMTFTHPKLTS